VMTFIGFALPVSQPYYRGCSVDKRLSLQMRSIDKFSPAAVVTPRDQPPPGRAETRPT
jgi:hypothetical protein